MLNSAAVFYSSGDILIQDTSQRISYNTMEDVDSNTASSG